MDYKKLFNNKVILITGGTGFLGKALVAKILEYEPKSIRVFSRDEFKHHKVQELFKFNPKLRNLVGDVRDFERLKKACEGADIVIHAAALKRLDLLEYNVEESIKTNILGTLNVVNACLQSNVQKAIFISTDKACSPVNTYGACKFVSERIFNESNFNKGARNIVFTCVRYGNVLESTGSVIPFFESKIKNNEKIPLTDPRMTRFIISSDQAVNLIFDALEYSVGGEVFVPILPAFKVTDLIKILKKKHSSDVGTELIGLRPGEKIHETMVNSAEIPRTFRFKNMYVITSSIEKYVDVRKPAYYVKRNLLNESVMKEYTSEHAVIGIPQIEKLFKQLGLL